MKTSRVFDLAIIGTGPAGFTASIYASRYDLSNIIIGKMLGGQAAEAHLVQNYPPFKEISGQELMMKFKEHAESYGAPIVYDQVVKIEGSFGNFSIATEAGDSYSAKAILLAHGLCKRKLGVPGEAEFLGKGVSYCATCDAQLFRGKRVAVIGGADAANTASLYLANLASKTYQIYRKAKLRGEVIWAKKVEADKRIEVIYDTNITEIEGEKVVTSVILDKQHNGMDRLEVDGVFIEAGCDPDMTLPKQLGIELTDDGLVHVNAGQATNIRGVWAAGDSTDASNKLRQIITAAAEGAIAAENVFQSIQSEGR